MPKHSSFSRVLGNLQCVLSIQYRGNTLNFQWSLSLCSSLLWYISRDLTFLKAGVHIGFYASYNYNNSINTLFLVLYVTLLIGLSIFFIVSGFQIIRAVQVNDSSSPESQKQTQKFRYWVYRTIQVTISDEHVDHSKRSVQYFELYISGIEFWAGNSDLLILWDQLNIDLLNLWISGNIDLLNLWDQLKHWSVE